MPNFASPSPAPIEPTAVSDQNSSVINKRSNELRFTLTSTLQNSLDIQDTLGHFYKMLLKAIACSGVSYQFSAMDLSLSFGTRRAHKAKYSLTTSDGSLGDIAFFRDKRFSEEELSTLESLLGVLIPPLRNALLYKKALDSSLRDPLTQIGNRVAMEAALKRELTLAKRNDQPLSLLMADIDFFKSINDNFGHQAGDDYLIQSSKILQDTLRQTDQVFRFGGEEFVILLSNTSHNDAMIIADRIRLAIEQTILEQASGDIQTTLSIGISTCRDFDSREQLFERADKALYRAKDRGRNRIEGSESGVCDLKQRA